LYRPRLRVIIGQALKNSIFKFCEHYGNAKSRFIFHVVARFDRPTNGAAFSVFPILAFDEIIVSSMNAKFSDDGCFDRVIVVISKHFKILVDVDHRGHDAA
jgi:hypothetical protein